MAKHRLDMETQEIAPGVLRISEYDFANCYLVTGTQKACLVDCGVGIGRMRALVEQHTTLPLTVLVTHAHADHDGGSVWFPEVYIHPLEMERNRKDITPYWRAYILKSHKYKRVSHGIRYYECLRRDYKPRLLPLAEGDRFDLGGRVLESYLTPGHTDGHMVFRDTKTGIVFAGDNANPSCMLQFPGAATVEAWIDGARRILEIADGAPLYGGHGKGAIPAAAVEATIKLAEEVCQQPNAAQSEVVKKTAGEKLPFIIYKSDKIH